MIQFSRMLSRLELLFCQATKLAAVLRIARLECNLRDHAINCLSLLRKHVSGWVYYASRFAVLFGELRESSNVNRRIDRPLRCRPQACGSSKYIRYGLTVL